MKYTYYVSSGKRTVYSGPDAADAMAAWSKAVTDGTEYVFLEALRAMEEARGA